MLRQNIRLSFSKGKRTQSTDCIKMQVTSPILKDSLGQLATRELYPHHRVIGEIQADRVLVGNTGTVSRTILEMSLVELIISLSPLYDHGSTKQ